MERNELFRQTITAVALGDGEQAKALNARIQQGDREDFFTFVAAVFAGAVHHWFGEDRSRAAVDRFVNEMRHDFRKADPPIKPLVIEGLIRALFGEDHLLDDTSGDDQFLSQYVVIRKIVDQSDHMKERFDDYLSDAELLAHEWGAEGT